MSASAGGGRETIKDVLSREGLAQYISILKEQGMERVEDLACITEQDLVDMGIDKTFHRKKLLRLGGHDIQQSPLRGSTTSGGGDDRDHWDGEKQGQEQQQMNFGGRIAGGDRIVVEVLGARGNSGKLSEKEFYVKGVLCTYANRTVVPVGTGQKTKPARGPFPIWGSESMPSERFTFETDFRAHCVAFELKEKRMITDNKVVGVVIFPPKFFHKFEPDTVADSWWPLRLAFEDEGEVQAFVRLRFTVPGGCPAGAKGKIFHVKGVSMTQRKLRLTIFEAELGSKSKNALYGGDGNAFGVRSRSNSTTSSQGGGSSVGNGSGGPKLYVQIVLDDDEHTVRQTAVVEGTDQPAFDETFEFFAEVSQAKLIKIMLKEKRLLGSDKILGTLMIPIQFFLCQKEATDIDEVHALLGESDTTSSENSTRTQTGRVHVRLEVRKRQGSEKRVNFTRTRSIKEEVQRNSGGPSLEEELGTVMVDADGAETTDDEDMS